MHERRVTKGIATAILAAALMGAIPSHAAEPAAAPQAAGATYFVSPKGDDAAAGTLEAPWKTPAFAITKLKAGDTLYVRGNDGEYKGEDCCNIRPRGIKGTAEKPIVVSGYPGDPIPVLNAGWVGSGKQWEADGDRNQKDGGPTGYGMKKPDASSASKEGKGVVLEGEEYWTFRWLHFKGYMEPFLLGEDSDVSHIRLEHLKITETNVGGTKTFYNPAAIKVLKATDSIVRHCEISGEMASALKVMSGQTSTRNLTIENNWMHHCLMGPAFKWAQDVASVGHIVRNNIIEEIEAKGIYLAPSGVTIQNNLFVNAGIGLHPGIEIGGNGLGNVVKTGADSDIQHNTFVAGSGIAVPKNFGYGSKFRDCLFFNVNIGAGSNLGAIACHPYGKTDDPHRCTADYNLYFNAEFPKAIRDYDKMYDLAEWQAAQKELDAHSIQAKPQFQGGEVRGEKRPFAFAQTPGGKSEASGEKWHAQMQDFRLAKGSPGKDAASDGKDMGVCDWENLGPKGIKLADGKWVLEWSVVPKE